jgi:hypothetical protein
MTLVLFKPVICFFKNTGVWRLCYANTKQEFFLENSNKYL